MSAVNPHEVLQPAQPHSQQHKQGTVTISVTMPNNDRAQGHMGPTVHAVYCRGQQPRSIVQSWPVQPRRVSETFESMSYLCYESQ